MEAGKQFEDTEVLRAIEALSADETPLDRAVQTQGPGGQAYDREPSPTRPAEAPLARSESMAEKALALNDKLGELAPAAKRVTEVLSRERASILMLGAFALALGVGSWLGRHYR